MRKKMNILHGLHKVGESLKMRKGFLICFPILVSNGRKYLKYTINYYPTRNIVAVCKVHMILSAANSFTKFYRCGICTQFSFDLFDITGYS